MFFSFLYFICFLLANNDPLLTINNVNYNYNDFYAFYPKQQWAVADSIKREEVYSNFIKRHLCILEAKNIGLNRGPNFRIKSNNSLRQLLVNETYEQLVAIPLIDKKTIENAKTFAKKEALVKHILIGHVGAQLRSKQTRSIDEALILSLDVFDQFNNGALFEELAEKYSDDPGVQKNSGTIGWVGWGQTVPEFEKAVFSSDVGVLSKPILTKYGYHLILVSDKRSSDLALLDVEEYENEIINLSKTSVRNKLRAAAVRYDSLQLVLSGLSFNFSILDDISKEYNKKNQENLLIGSAARVNVVEILDSMVGVVCTFNNKGFGGRWFANKMREIPSAQMPFFDSKKNIISTFKTIILQELAVINGKLAGVDKSFNYKKRSSSIINGLLYDSYLKFLVNSVVEPDSNNILNHYNKYKHKKYSDKSLNDVSSNISALLMKENQTLVKKDSINALFNKYNIIKNYEFLQN